MADKKSKTTISGGVGFSGLLTIVFIVLKLLEKITWSWVWVLSPLWIPAASTIAIGLIVIIVLLLVSVKRKKK